MYTHGLAARSIGLGSGSAGWAVAAVGFGGSWVRGGRGCLGRFLGWGCPVSPCGFNFPSGVCAVGPPRARGQELRPIFPAPPWGSGCTVMSFMAFSPCVVGWCGGVPRPWVCFFPFTVVRRLHRDRPTVSVRCLCNVVCFGVPCCAVLCFAVLSRAAPRCAALRPALPCRAVPCCAMSCLAVLRRVTPCCAVPCSFPLCRAVSRGAVPCCAAL